jgi:hypothetical protein
VGELEPGESSEQGSLAVALPLAADVMLTGAAAGTAVAPYAAAVRWAHGAGGAAAAGAHRGVLRQGLRWLLRSRVARVLGAVGGGVLVLKAQGVSLSGAVRRR